MSAAGDAIRASAVEALASVPAIGRVYDAPPLQAALPHALVAIDLESDWSHKSGAGRDVRLAVSIFDKAERPERLRRLAGEAETALGAIGGSVGGWRVATMVFLRTRIVRGRDGVWVAIVEFRARLLAAG